MAELRSAPRNALPSCGTWSGLCTAVVSEFEKISRDESLGTARTLFNSARSLSDLHSELRREACPTALPRLGYGYPPTGVLFQKPPIP